MEAEANEAGYPALGSGRAREARAIFTAVVAEQGSAEAQEVLNSAALALDDADATIDARQAAY